MQALLSNPMVVAGGMGVLAIGAAAAYNYFTGNETSADIDLDDDGNEEVSVGFAAEDTSDKPPLYEDGIDGEEETKADSKPADSLPETLEDVTGVGPSKAEKLRSVGYTSPEDLYNASDSELENINTFGPAVVEQIRDDIGSVAEGASESPSTDGDEIGQTGE